MPEVLRGTNLNYNAGVRHRYEAKLLALVNQMTAQTNRKLRAFYKQEHDFAYFAADADMSSQARILMNEIYRRFQQLFNAKSKGLAEGMMKDSNKASAAAMKGSLKKLSAGLTIKTDVISGTMKTIMKAQIAENVALIRSIPSQYFTQVQGSVMRSITTGNGLADLLPALQKYDGITQRRAKLIATDQTRKAFSNLNHERMVNSGIKKFEWVHSGGGMEPRRLHLELNGKIFSLDDLPVIDEDTGERGIPGQLINCRCVSRPIVDFGGE